MEVDGGETLDFKLLVGNFERGLIHEALAHSAGNRNAAARALGIDERTLAVKLRKYEL